ncbi:hypothetical protein M569_13680 [Genlisea aurea]|uniref:Uncharacterized protein n=1 Tax=Genlisea aurea TaxID=192259 RepID=S8DEB7_9LAMI|nr:hypothetical protein M569_13680 [Genlisea aurea]
MGYDIFVELVSKQRSTNNPDFDLNTMINEEEEEVYDFEDESETENRNLIDNFLDFDTDYDEQGQEPKCDTTGIRRY